MKKLIGNTPMIKINYEINNAKKSVYIKLEYYNLTGSIKDRVVYYIIKKAKESNRLKNHQPIVEATSGNTGISLSAIGSYFNHDVYIFMPDWVSTERKKLMEMYGAQVFLISKEDGGFLKCIEKCDTFSKKIDGFKLDQFNNYDNIMGHYETTGLEIIEKLNRIDAFISGIGTGGTLMGVSRQLKNFNDCKIFALEPDSLPIVSKGIKNGTHKIEGIGDDFIPELVDLSLVDEVLLVNDLDSINMSKKLAKELGLGVGISSGANLIGAILVNEKINGNVVTVFPDDNKKYLTTDLSKEIKRDCSFVSDKIKLIDYEVI